MIRTRPGTATVDGRRLERARARFAADVRRSLALSPRQLPSRYLYDDLGSALFEAICRLPWYRITRAEEHLTLTFVKARTKWGKQRPSIPSRFLMELRGDTERAKRAAEAAQKLFGASERPAPETPEQSAPPARTAAASRPARAANSPAGAPAVATAGRSWKKPRARSR